MTTTELVIKLTCFIAAGYAVVKSGTVSHTFFKQFSAFLITIPMSALIVRSFLGSSLSGEVLGLFGTTILCAVLMLTVLALVGLAARKLHRNAAEGRICVFGMMTSNFNFFGIPIVEVLFGSEGILYYTVLTTLARVVYYGFPPFMLGSGHKLNLREFARQMICPPVVALAVGFVLFFAQVQLPFVLNDVLNSLGNTASPLGMMLCGMTLANADLKKALTRPILLVMSAIRLLAAPATVLGLCLLCRFPPLISKLAVIYSMLPFGALMPTFASRYCADEQSAIYGSVLVSLTTVLCMFTIPLWLHVMNTML